VRRRLDVEMVRRGLAGTRSEAGSAVRDGRVTVAGRTVTKAGSLVAPEEPIHVRGTARRFASRGGEKLDAALDRMDVPVEDVVALDGGASTGGFTDCLLRRGARRVYAVDVGYGQIDLRLRRDPRVVVMERTNVRDLRAEDLPERPEVLTADLSFISLRLVLPALAACAEDVARMVLLVKPQFEAGRREVGRGGVVRDPAVWERAIRGVAVAARAQGFEPVDVMASPLAGPAGNAEFLLYARRGPGAAREPAFEAAVGRAIAEALTIVPRPGARAAGGSGGAEGRGHGERAAHA
jgi:23S rRNA (cytidine1920-2'-O)/16S rRNA (cytidine1409-2'-O)-methyltransferase